jgi:hypothetical protein
MPREAQANWLQSAEHIGAGYPRDPAEFDTPAWRGYDVLTHTPPERRAVDELHRRGIRCLPYLTLSYQYIGSDYAGWDAEETLDGVIIDQLGRPQLHPNYLRHDGKLVYEMCPSVRQIRDRYLARAEAILKSGADGLFLDNGFMSRKCWGPHYGRHDHLFAGDPQARAAGHRPYCYSKAARKYRLEIPVVDDEQTYATAMLIREIRDLARSFGPDRRLMLNSGDGSGIAPLIYEQLDSAMNEMFVYTTYLDYNLPVPTNLDFQDHDLFDWLSVLEWQDQFHRSGVRMACLSAYSAHDPERRRHSLFAFCAAKLWDALYYTTTDLALDAWLRAIRLGRPLTDQPGSWGAVLYREYEGGLIVLNPYGVAQQATVPWTGKPQAVQCHGDAAPVAYDTLARSKGALELKLGPDRAALIVPAA